MDVMIDIETMGVGRDAAVITIGAVVFDKIEGDLGEEFYGKIDFNDALLNGEADSKTIAWWLQQSEPARMELISGGDTFEVVMESFYKFCKRHDRYRFWAKGPCFDMVILESAFARCGYEPPWQFWNIRDLRTIIDLNVYRDIVRTGGVTEGVAHNALDDAKNQARYVIDIYSKPIDRE